MGPGPSWPTTCFLWGQTVGTGHISASQTPGGCLLGGLVSGLRCHTAGSSAYSHSHLRGSRGSITPQGPVARQAGWPSGCGQAGLALMPPPVSLGRLGHPGVSTGTFPTAPSHDPCAHPAGYGPGLSYWGPLGSNSSGERGQLPAAAGQTSVQKTAPVRGICSLVTRFRIRGGVRIRTPLCSYYRDAQCNGSPTACEPSEPVPGTPTLPATSCFPLYQTCPCFHPRDLTSGQGICGN